MIRLLGDLIGQIMFLSVALMLGFCLIFFMVGLILWVIEKIQGLFK
jgi:hypothetical protein